MLLLVVDAPGISEGLLFGVAFTKDVGDLCGLVWSETGGGGRGRALGMF